MILYNMRHRGPYEYDKFVLNILQIYNGINLAETNEMYDNAQKRDSLKAIENSINEIHVQLFGDEKNKGLCQEIYEKSYIINGGM